MGSPRSGRVTAVLCALGASPAPGPGTPALLPLPVLAPASAPRSPVNASPPPRQTATRSRQGEKAFLLRAQEHLRRRESGKAVAALKQGLASHPRSVALHLAVAGILARQGDQARARSHYRRVVELAPRRVEGYFGLAQVAFTERDYPASAAALQKVLRIDPGSAPAHAKLGMTYAQQFRTPEAIASLKKAVALDPGSAEAQFYLGDLMRRLSRLDEAQYHLERALALQPRNARFYSALGELFLQRDEGAGSSERALAVYQQALQLDPRLADAHYGVGRVYARRRRWREAAEALRTALRLNPALGRAHLTLAHVYQRLGQPAEAAAQRKAFRRYRAGATPPAQ